MTWASGSDAPNFLLAVVGPTAVGKSEVALQLARQLNGEIISVDSMQVYCGMDVGTAKPGPNERCEIPHHLIDVVEITTGFDAAQFVALARQAVGEIRARNKLPILCGGTGLYFKAFFEGLGQAPPADLGLRTELEKTPLPELLNELAESDPVTYEGIDRKNVRRVVRALEVIRLTGKPYSLQRAGWSQPISSLTSGLAIFGLRRAPADLWQRIDARVESMFQQGLVAETKTLLEVGLLGNRTALQALGYRQAVEHLQGTRSLHETISLVKTRTRQFAKRQMTWFRRQLPVEWIDVACQDSAVQIACEISFRLSDRSLVV
jgi:tRNA dimethylallyltransferase